MPSAIKLVVGLGNPGAKYARTRHNVGFWLVDQLAQEYSGSFRAHGRMQGELTKIHLVRDLFVLKPTTFMNLSGSSVGACANYYQIDVSEILVVHDELDLPAGTVRLKKGGGHGGHNGLRDIVKHVGNDFIRLRIGVGDPDHPSRGANFVLTAPPAEQAAAIEASITKALAEFSSIVSGDIDRAMNALNRKSNNGDQL